MPPITDEAICIRQWDWSETSQTVSLFMRATGIVRAVAKGSKRPKSPFSGGLEVLTLGEATFTLKRPGALSIVTAWDLRDPFPAIRRELARFHTGVLIADLLHHALREEDPHAGLFDATARALAELTSTPTDAARTLLTFQWALARETGHRPDLDRHADTGAALDPAQTYVFSSELGGLVPDPPERQPPGRTWRVREETVSLLRESRDGSCPPGPMEAIVRANRLLATHLSERLGAEIPSLEAWARAVGV